MIIRIRRGRLVGLYPSATWHDRPVEDRPLRDLDAQIRSVFGRRAHWELRP